MNIQGLDKRYQCILMACGAYDNKVLPIGLRYVLTFCGDVVQGSFFESKEEVREYALQWHITRLGL